jgi:hypothetical protein
LICIPPHTMWHCARANFNNVKNSRMLIKPPINLIKQGQQTQERQKEVLESITQKATQLVSDAEEVVVLTVQRLVNTIGMMCVYFNEVSLQYFPNALLTSLNSPTPLFLRIQIDIAI